MKTLRIVLAAAVVGLLGVLAGYLVRVPVASAQMRQTQDILNAWDTPHLVECFNDTILPNEWGISDTVDIGRNAGNPSRFVVLVDIDTLGNRACETLNLLWRTAIIAENPPAYAARTAGGAIAINLGKTASDSLYHVSTALSEVGGDKLVLHFRPNADTLAVRARVWMCH